MKKRLLALGTLLIATLSLTACDFLMPFIDGGSDAYSYRPGGRSSDEIFSSNDVIDSSLPPEGELTAKKASYNYMDYIQNNANPLSSTPCVGSANLLVIPVWFTDSTNFISTSKRDDIKSDIEKAYFGTNSETGWRSVKTYYEEESHGALTLTGKVSNWYECGESYTRYKTDDGYVTKTRNLVDKAAKWYFDNNPSDTRKNYDKDGDGYLDGVMVIYGAPDSQALNVNNADNLWAFCYWMADPTVKSTFNPGLNAFFWASYDYMYNSKAASNRTGKSSYNNGDTAHCNIDAHTYIHEMGHMFGLDDYYDYSDHTYTPAGKFSMQDHNVGSHDPFSVYALGWGKAYIPTESITINLKKFTTTGEVILLSPSFNEFNSPFDEYLLLEYYTPTELNELDTTYGYQNSNIKGSPERGIRLWHVDARLLVANNGYVDPNKMTSNPRVLTGNVVQAFTNTYDDGTEKTESYLSPLGSAYYDFNFLQLIRKNGGSYRPEDSFSTNSLFREGAEFSMDRYQRQFVKGAKLNSGKTLGFAFRVNKIYEDYISISIYKV